MHLYIYIYIQNVNMNMFIDMFMYALSLSLLKCLRPTPCAKTISHPRIPTQPAGGARAGRTIQGYIAHQKHNPPRTLQ